MQHLFNDLVRNGGDISTSQSAVRYMDGVADGSSNDLGVNVGIVQEHVMNGFDQFNAGLANVVQTAQERADVSSACAGSQQRLVGGEHQRAVGGNALGGQRLDGLQALSGHGDLDDHVLGVQGIDGFALSNHGFSVHGGGLYFAGNGAVHDGGDLCQGLGIIAAFLGNQTGVGGNTGNNAHVIGFTDLIYIRSINKKFHDFASFYVAFYLSFALYHNIL